MLSRLKCQRETDGRKLFSKEKENLCLRVERRIEAGIHPEDLARDLDLNRRAVGRWLEKYHYGGEDALKTEPRPGREPKLNAPQMGHLARMIRDRNPLQVNFTFVLWNRAMVRELIRREFGVRLSEISVGRLLRRLGFSPQRPLRRAYEQDRTRVEQWRREEFPAIQRQAKAENAIIFLADEAGVRSATTPVTPGRRWARPRWFHAPVPGFRCRCYRRSAPRAKCTSWSMKDRSRRTPYCEFLTRLAAGVERKIYLVVDGHSIHKAGKVQKHLAALSGRITLFFLAPYSPDLNADEWVWKQVRQRIARQSVRTRDDLRRVALSALRFLQQMPEKIRGFFRDPCCYAAAQVQVALSMVDLVTFMQGQQNSCVGGKPVFRSCSLQPAFQAILGFLRKNKFPRRCHFFHPQSITKSYKCYPICRMAHQRRAMACTAWLSRCGTGKRMPANRQRDRDVGASTP